MVFSNCQARACFSRITYCINYSHNLHDINYLRLTPQLGRKRTPWLWTVQMSNRPEPQAEVLAWNYPSTQWVHSQGGFFYLLRIYREKATCLAFPTLGLTAWALGKPHARHQIFPDSIHTRQACSPVVTSVYRPGEPPFLIVQDSLSKPRSAASAAVVYRVKHAAHQSLLIHEYYCKETSERSSDYCHNVYVERRII